MGAFEVLIEALQTEQQTGAVDILAPDEQASQSPPRIFNYAPAELKTFLNSDQQTMGWVLFSKSIKYSLIRIDEQWPRIKIKSKKTKLENCKNSGCQQVKACIQDKTLKLVHFTIDKKCLSIFKSSSDFTVDGCTVVTDIITWDCLSPSSKDTILQRNIQFQGRKQKLQSFVSKLCKLKSENKTGLLENLETEFLISLLKNSEPEVASGNLPNIPEKYIQRRLVSRKRLSKKIIGITKNPQLKDVLVFRGDDLQLYHLGSLVDAYGDGKRDCSTAQLKRKKITVNCILLDCEEDFEELSQKSENRYFHLIECIRGNNEEDVKDFKLFWLKTKGSIELIQNFVHNIQDHFPEENLYRTTSWQGNVTNGVCIADSPGMGKSCLLAKCGKELMTSNLIDDKSACYVQYFTMSNFVATYKAVKHERGTLLENQCDTREPELEALQRSCSNFFIGKELVCCLFQTHKDVIKENFLSDSRIHLMFDGIDELAEDQVDDSISIIQYFCKTHIFPVSVTVWVTTRPQYIYQIEETMNVLGYTIEQFSIKDQETLLTNYWGGDNEMRVLASKCIEKFNKRLILTDDQKNIIGFPLLCALLARIYEKEAKKKQGRNYILRTISAITIDKVFNSYVLERFKSGNIFNSKQSHAAFLKHLELALRTIFPDINGIDGFLTKNQHFKDQELFSYGLLEYGSATEPLRFVHKTIAEYLVAQSMLHVLSSMHQPESHFKIYMSLVRTVLSVRPSTSKLSNLGPHQYVIPHLHFKYPNVCFFLNFALVSRFKYDDEPEGSVRFSLDETLIDFRAVYTIFKSFTSDNELPKKVWHRLIAATKANHYHIAHPLLKALEMLFPQDGDMKNFLLTLPDYELPSLVYLASRFSSFELAEKVYDLSNFCYQDKPILKYCMKEMSFHFIVDYNTDYYHDKQRIHSYLDCQFRETFQFPDVENVLRLIFEFLRTKLKGECNPNLVHNLENLLAALACNFEGTPLNVNTQGDSLNVSHLSMNSLETSPRYPSSPTLPVDNPFDLDLICAENTDTSSIISEGFPTLNSSIDYNDQWDRIIVNIDLFSLYFSDSKLCDDIPESTCPGLESLSHVLTPLHCAVEAGNDKLTKHLLERDSETISSLDYNFRYLLHFCLLNSINDSSVVLTKKENILRLFKSKFPYIINDNPACIGICLEKIHLRLLVSYIKLKHELNPDWHVLSTNNYGENMLHLLAAGHYDNDMTSEKYHNSLLELQKVGLNIGRHLIEYNHLNWRAVDVAVASMDLLDTTFKLFQQLDVNFNFVDFRGSSILNKAVSGQRGEETLRKLIELGATFAPKYFGETVLHTSAVFFNFEAVQFFVTEGLNLNFKKDYSEESTLAYFDSDNFYFKHLTYHLEQFKDQLDDLHCNTINDDTKIRYHFEKILHDIDNLPYCFEKIRNELTQFYVPKSGVYNSEEDYLPLKRVYDKLRDILDEFPIFEDNYFNEFPDSLLLNKNDNSKKSSKNLPGDTYITANLQDKEGNTPLHMCFRYEMHLLEFKASRNEGNSSQIDPQTDYLKQYKTSIPVKRRFLGSTSAASYVKSSHISRYQHIDLEPNNQHKILSFLIEHGASIAIPNNNFVTPMDLAIQLCVDGLTDKDELKKLEKAQTKLFSKPEYMTLALKGLLLNTNLGYTCHPKLVKSFANAIRDHCGDIHQKHFSDDASLLHLAARRHSYFGVEYITESNAFSAKILDKFNRNALEYMNCSASDCKMLNCKKIRDHLKQFMI